LSEKLKEKTEDESDILLTVAETLEEFSRVLNQANEANNR